MGPGTIGQVAGVYHRRVGHILVTALNDGHQDAALATVCNIPGEEAGALLHAAYRPVPRRTAVNTFLIRSAGRVALVDTGCGPTKPTVGMLPANLAAAGVAPDQVDTVLMTHLNPDHFGGLVQNEQAGSPPPSSCCTRTSTPTGTTRPRWTAWRTRRGGDRSSAARATAWCRTGTARG